MNGTMARLLGLLAVASTLILGGCVAETGEEQVIAAKGPVTRVESLPGARSAGAAGQLLPAAAPAPAVPAAVDANDPAAIDVAPVEVIIEDETGDPQVEPEPSPWKPPAPHI